MVFVGFAFDNEVRNFKFRKFAYCRGLSEQFFIKFFYAIAKFAVYHSSVVTFRAIVFDVKIAFGVSVLF